MKRLILLLLSASLLSACSFFKKEEAPAPALVKRQVRDPNVGSDGSRRARVGGTEIEKVDFRPGISSATVERMAMAESCKGGVGAGLVSEAGPVEVYRMACDNGKVFMARCELRQCKPMAGKPASTASK